MSDYVPREKNKHLTHDDRIDIENCLSRNLKLKEIASYVHCDERTVAKEIVRNRQLVETKEPNKCSRKTECHRHLLCGANDSCKGECRNCKGHNCNVVCPDFRKEPTCKRLRRFPYTCNACPRRCCCRFCKFIYSAKPAHDAYRANLEGSRSHIHFDDDQIKAIDAVVSPMVRKGYSPEVILMEKSDELPAMSVATLYKIIDLRLLSVRNIDLKRKVRREFHKERGKKPAKADAKCKAGRHYEDFLEYAGANPTALVWELDTVEGRKGGKCLMTLLERRSNFMLMFLLGEKTEEEVGRTFARIRKSVGAETFKETFPVILTDNGCEFLDPESIEFDPATGEKLCNVYYCEARHSEQKGKLEKNHEHVREVLPKGTDLDFLTDEAVDVVSNNVNNYPRPQFRTSPLAMVMPYISKKVLRLNNLKPLKEVLLKPELLDAYRGK